MGKHVLLVVHVIDFDCIVLKKMLLIESTVMLQYETNQNYAELLCSIQKINLQGNTPNLERVNFFTSNAANE